MKIRLTASADIIDIVQEYFPNATYYDTEETEEYTYDFDAENFDDGYNLGRLTKHMSLYGELEGNQITYCFYERKVEWNK